MAHKLDESKGRPAFVAFQAPGWHNLGKVFTEAITKEDALKEGGLDFKVFKEPNIHAVPGVPDFIISKNSFFTYRDDTKAVLGDRLGKDYTVYQNDEALEIIDDLLKTGKVRIETAGAIEEGRRVFVCLKIMEPIKVGGKDVVEQYILLVNAHDGSMAITALFTNVRVVCFNTLSAALAGARAAHKIRHTRNAQDRVKEAFAIMGISDKNRMVNEASYEMMRKTGVSKETFFDYIGNIFLDEKEISELQKGNKAALSTRKKNIIEGVFDFAETGVGQREALGDGNLNMWYGYNAVTGFLTSKKYRSEYDRFYSLLLGESAKKIKVDGDLALHPDWLKPLKQTTVTSLN